MAVFLRLETVFVRKIVTRCTLFETYFNLQKTILSTTPPDSNCKHARTAGIFDAENVCALQQKPLLHFPSRCLPLGKQKTQTKDRYNTEKRPSITKCLCRAVFLLKTGTLTE